ncbi:MAG: GNAT family N-acetyltransferase [Janthinobacterium lividum]
MSVFEPFSSVEAGAPGAAPAVWAPGPGPVAAAPRRPLAFEPLLFLQPAHQALQPPAGPVLSFYLEDAGQTVGQLHVVADPASGRARSPGQAPFGGAQLAPGLGVAAVHALFGAAEAALRGLGQRQLAVRGYPFCYDPAGAAALAEALHRRGYRVALAEQNHHLDLARDYAAGLHPSERRRLHKCARHGLVVEQEHRWFLPRAHAFLSACRQERGQAPPLPLARLEALFEAFPDDYFLFSVRAPSGEWAALTIAVRVSGRVLYNFYPASPLSQNALSPVVLLNEGLHAFARASGLAVLDLGTSTLPEGPNVSLLRFKRHLGATAGLRLSWEKDW